MALTNAAKVGTQGPFATMKATGAIRVKIDFDTPYAGGYAAFVATTLKGISGLEEITVIDIPVFMITAAAMFYLCRWIRATDVLEVIDPTTGAEVGAINLSAFTAQELVVWVQ